ncbi:hypothetical protein [Nonomuraea endophytica]|uniref:Uncharacterized protein n=1 Tax=Nonomuraea endophytica TaxID=714136 RepID=A0A7W8A4S9_9ACTN|nr:hypothetical protein [Nonomuraea endophytica]MBB5079577.1 hypothetical protein [Nonomuraea endophytica]
MPRRALALTTAALACLGALAVSTAPAQAAGPIDIVMSPLSIGEYCAAKVHSSSIVGFYNGSLGCYRYASPNLIYLGSGSPSAACQYYNPTYTYLGYAQGGAQSLVCKYSV